MFFLIYEDQPDKITKIYSKTGKWLIDLNSKKILEMFQSNTLTTQDFLSSQYKISKDDMIEKIAE